MSERYDVKPEKAKVLKELEKIIGKSIPQVEAIDDGTVGVKFEGDNIVGLGLYKQGRMILPESIGNLESLQELYLMDNKLTTLPESIGNLISLQKLCLRGNWLWTLPESIGNLKSLQELDLSINKLTTLPESITKLEALQELDLSENKLTTLPESITKLETLQGLILGDNKLTTLPESITKLKSLQGLNLGDNKLTTIPESIGNLISLQSLSLRGNQLSSLPKSMTKLISLRSLSLFYNKLKSLPKSITKLTSLKNLDLSTNKLTTLPESIGNLISLQTLNLSENKLTTLPDSLWRCKNLKSLGLVRNPWKGEWKEIEKFDLPKVLEKCRQRAPITVFITHSKGDKNKYSVNNLKERLKGQKEIHEVYSSGENAVSESQLLIFIATKNSITDTRSLHELGLALTHGIGIIPIKGIDIEFDELKQINLKAEGHGYFDLGDKLGFEFDSKKVKLKEFCNELYEYIKQYKRDFNLFDGEERKINAERENVKIIIEELIESMEFRENFMENLTQLKAIYEELRTEQISPIEYILRWIQILNSKSK